MSDEVRHDLVHQVAEDGEPHEYRVHLVLKTLQSVLVSVNTGEKV